MERRGIERAAFWADLVLGVLILVLAATQLALLFSRGPDPSEAGEARPMARIALVILPVWLLLVALAAHAQRTGARSRWWWQAIVFAPVVLLVVGMLTLP